MAATLANDPRTLAETANDQDSATQPVQTPHGNLLRVLKRQPDGSWKFARVMWGPGE